MLRSECSVTPTFLTSVLLPAALAVIMFGLGLSMVWGDFRRVLLQPKAVLTGVAAQLILLPLAGVAVVALVPMEPELAVGLILLALCPGGPTASLITHLSKGDTPLSVALTAITSLTTVFVTPFLANWALQTYMGASAAVSLPLGSTVLQLLAITLVPVGAGMAVRGKWPQVAERLEGKVKILSGLFLILIVFAAIAREWESLPRYFAQAGISALALNLAAIGIGLAAGWLLKLSREEKVCLAVDTSICNGTLAIFIAATLIKNPEMAVPAAIYSLLMFATGAAIMAWENRRPKEASQAAAG